MAHVKQSFKKIKNALRQTNKNLAYNHNKYAAPP
jgi:hypothetical protein